MLISFSWLRKVKGLEEKTEPSSLNFLLSKEVFEDLASEATDYWGIGDTEGTEGTRGGSWAVTGNLEMTGFNHLSTDTKSVLEPTWRKKYWSPKNHQVWTSVEQRQMRFRSVSYLTKKWVDRSKLGGTEHGGADIVMRRSNRIILCNLLDSLKILWRRELQELAR